MTEALDLTVDRPPVPRRRSSWEEVEDMAHDWEWFDKSHSDAPPNADLADWNDYLVDMQRGGWLLLPFGPAQHLDLFVAVFDWRPQGLPFVDVVKLESDEKTFAWRAWTLNPAEDPLAPSKVYWHFSGDALSAVEQMISLPDPYSPSGNRKIQPTPESRFSIPLPYRDAVAVQMSVHVFKCETSGTQPVIAKPIL